MSEIGTSPYKLSNARISEGVWQGMLIGPKEGDAPQIKVSHFDTPLADAEVIELPDGDGWQLRVPIPAEVIADGLQTFVIRDGATDTTLSSFAILAGEALTEDLRAEIGLLRAELDMLKRAFRRHCLETA